MCLAAIGVPTFVIQAIKQLYKNNIHIWRFGGICGVVFSILSGVKQGCPLSALLFVIAIDPFLRALRARVGVRGMVRADADDVAIVCANIWRHRPGIAMLYAEFAEFSNFKTKSKKCTLISLLGDGHSLWP